MKARAAYLVIFFTLLFSAAFSAYTDLSNASLQSMMKQRTDQYLNYAAIQGEQSDSLKLIIANTIFEIDNTILNKVVSLDSINVSQAKQLNVFEKRKSLSKKGHLISRIAGSALFLLFCFSLVLLYVSKKKAKKLANANIKNVKNLEALNSELIGFKIEKEKNEAALRNELNNIQNELKKKIEISLLFESKITDYQKNETTLNSNLLALKEEAEELEKQLNLAINQTELFTSQLTIANAKINEDTIAYDSLIEQTNQITQEKNILLKNNSDLSEQLNIIVTQKSESDNKLNAITQAHKEYHAANESLFNENISLAEANKTLVQKVSELEAEKSVNAAELQINIADKNNLLNKLYKADNEKIESKVKFPEYEIKAIREMVETNFETLKLAYIKVQTEKDQLGKALRMREPEEVLMVKINKLVEENFSLQLDIEDEKAYAEKLNEKLDKYLDQLERQDLELELLSLKVKDRIMPENRVKFDEMELNLVKIEKLNRLKENSAITEEEYQMMKHNIITQL